MLVFNQESHAPRTRLEYAKDWKHFARWCEAQNYVALPASAETVITYLTKRLDGGGKLISCRRYVTSINDKHRRENFPIPAHDAVQRFLSGAQRIRKEWPVPKHALKIEELRAICERLSQSPEDVRLRAILTLGFASALRRMNLAALEMRDLDFCRQGLTIQVRYEKQDQVGKGRTIGIVAGSNAATCPVAAMRAWLNIRGEAPGPVFRSMRSSRVLRVRLGTQGIANAVKRAVEMIGLDPRPYAGHSLRSGFVTRALEAGQPEVVICRHTGHRSLASLQRYFRATDPFRANPSGALGL